MGANYYVKLNIITLGMSSEFYLYKYRFWIKKKTTFFECSSIEKRHNENQRQRVHSVIYSMIFVALQKFQAEIILEFNLPLATKQLVEWSQIPPPCHFILGTFN